MRKLIFGVITMVFGSVMCGCGNKPTAPLTDEQKDSIWRDTATDVCGITFESDTIFGNQ